jgi:hypothetical protein
MKDVDELLAFCDLDWQMKYELNCKQRLERAIFWLVAAVIPLIQRVAEGNPSRMDDP